MDAFTNEQSGLISPLLQRTIITKLFLCCFSVTLVKIRDTLLH